VIVPPVLSLIDHQPTEVVTRRINISHIRVGTTMSNIVAKHSPKRHRWIVEFAFRVRDDRQSRALTACGLLTHEVVRLWVQIVTPGAVVHEPPGTPVKTVLFASRASARRFASTFGGKIERHC
jgi:hypothetical protein